ncbi:MAG TPA: hypothetical protein ACQGQG_09775 [Xylella sp.]
MNYPAMAMLFISSPLHATVQHIEEIVSHFSRFHYPHKKPGIGQRLKADHDQHH